MYGPSIAREIHLQNGLPENANDTIPLKVYVIDACLVQSDVRPG